MPNYGIDLYLSHCAQASSRSKKHAQFFFFFLPQIGRLQPLFYLNFDLKEKNVKNRENEKHKFAGGLVREGGNASLVVGVTRAVYKRTCPRTYAFSFRNFEGCSGPIFVLKVAK